MFAAKEAGSRGFSQYEVTFLVHGKGSGSFHRDCYMVCVPLYLLVPMKEYLNKYSCKFSGQYSIDRNRAEFFVEEFGHPKMLQALIERTLANGGKVDISSNQLAVVETEVEELTVELEPCPLTENNVLSIKYRGRDIPCTGDDCDDYDWWVASGIEPKLTPFINMAVMQPNVTFHYDTRINIGLREYLETFGFNWNPETEMMQMFM